jgi:hypothetical protein
MDRRLKLSEYAPSFIGAHDNSLAVAICGGNVNWSIV